jgi:hypothetical protein
MSEQTPPSAPSERETGPSFRRWIRLRPPGKLAISGFIVGVLLVAGLGALGWWLPQRSSGETANVEPPVAWQRPPVPASGLVERSGVRLIRVAVTGGGGLLDLRYQVVDPNKAVAVHQRETPPAIVDERTGLVFSQLLMDHAHTGELKPAVTYYLVFENTGNWVRRGTEVTVLLGDAQVENVVVK